MVAKVAKILACIVVFAVLCIPAVFVNTAIGYLPALFFLMLLALCFVYLRICARSLSSDALSGADSCVRGSTVGVLLRVRNAAPLLAPHVDVSFSISDLFGEDALVETSSIAIRPHDTEDFEFDLGFSHLGEFQVGLRELVVHDPSGLFSATIPGNDKHSVLVTPRLRELDVPPLSDTTVRQVTDALKSSYSSGEDYCGVRDYSPGDPMKLIHWKLSARTNDYFTKIFDTHADPSLDIYVNFSSPEYDSETLMSLYDVAVETALALAAYAYEHSMATRLVFLNGDGQADRFQLGHGVDLRDLMQRLPRIQVGESGLFCELLSERASSVHAADNIAVCSPYVDAALGTALARVRSTRRNVFMLAMVPSELDRQRRTEALASLRLLGDMGIACSVIDVEGGVRP